MSHFKRHDPFSSSSSSHPSFPFPHADFAPHFAPPLPPPPPPFDAFFPDPLDHFDDLDLDLFLPNEKPSHHLDLLADPYLAFLSDRVAALELAIAPPPPPPRRKYTCITESGNRKLKYTVDDKGFGERTLKYEAVVKSPFDDEGLDRKWNWEAKTRAGGAKKTVKYGRQVTGRGSLEPWSQSYSWEEVFGDGEDDDVFDGKKKCVKKVAGKKEEKKRGHGFHVVEFDDEEEKAVAFRKEEKKRGRGVQVVEIEDNGRGAIAMRKAFAKAQHKGKRKQYSPQDAALLIQLNFRAHLARRSQVLRCLRDLAVAKAKLKEIRALFYNMSYRRRVAHDAEERQRFGEKIIVLLLTVDALVGPDYMVRVAKKTMLEELEGMLEVVDPQPHGKLAARRRRFDLPSGVVSHEMASSVNNVVRIVEEGH